MLDAKTEWPKVLELARSKDLQIIISNTTEVGIQLIKENIFQHPPVSFPAKLLAVLFERYNFFSGDTKRGMVVVPTELITNNADELKSILLLLAEFNQLEKTFINWLKNHNHFCNSLVDRIVTGKPDPSAKQKLEQQFGFEDELMIMAESYCLWAVEGDEHVKSILSFSSINQNIIIEKNIEIYRELKLRLLNGTHTLSCGLAFLAGFKTVQQSMNDNLFSNFIEELMLKEIAPSIPYSLPKNEANEFALKVLDRFRNPFIEHEWINICFQYTSKMKLRNILVLLQHYKMHSAAPKFFSLGFAAYLLFMKVIKNENDKYYGEANGNFYLIQDDGANYFFELWKKYPVDKVVTSVLQNENLWNADLSELNGFTESVKNNLHLLIEHGANAALTSISENL